MIPENVILIVKAPNQQIEDQNIECLSSWTVRQLKGHLSEVYPSKPSTDEQKIIYSGQLLDDNTVLKDVLRTYESQLGHTMHLVCAPSKTMPTPEPTGLRKRNVTTETTTNTETARPETARPETARPEMRQNDQNHTVEMQNYLTSFVNNYGRVPPYPNYNIGEGYLPVPNDQASLANHMMMMHQAYTRYMQQYADMWQATANPTPQPPTEAPPAPPAPEPNEEEEQDWLDHIYSASRLAILFSLIYLYGSPARLLLVIMLTVAAYLHQIGFFRELFVNEENANPNANANQAPRNQQAQQQQQPQQQQPQQQPPQQQQPQQQPQPQPNRPEETRNQTEMDRSPSFLAVSWMVFTSFFASLIPDTN